MAVTSNIEQFRNSLPGSGDRSRALLAIGQYAQARFAGRVRRSYFIQGDPVTDRYKLNPTNKLRIMSGRLMRAVAQKFTDAGTRESTTKIKLDDRGFIWTKTINVPYARIHEYGGTILIPVTSRMRRFFWAMHRETKEDRWKGMALSKKNLFSVRIPKRPYAGPAIRDERAAIERKALDEFIKLFGGR